MRLTEPAHGYIFCISTRPARIAHVIMSPLYRDGDILLYFSPLICSSHQLCVCAFSLSIMQAVKHETLSQCRAIVGPPSTTLSNISPVFGYRVVFDACLNVGQRHRRRANINPALASSSTCSYCSAQPEPGPFQ